MIKESVKLGKNVIIHHPELVNLYDCEIGDNCKIATFVEIGKNVKIGNNCRIQAFTFIPEGVILEDNVFIGPHVCFTNDLYPRVKDHKGWKLYPTTIKEGASIGANCTILCGITIGENSLIGAGTVVAKDIPANSLAYGNPLKIFDLSEIGEIK